MNPTIEQLLTRKSIRQFTGEAVTEEDFKLMCEAALRCPTSINGQQVSLVYTRNKETIKEIADLCGGQKQIETADMFVMFVADFHRTGYAVKSTGKTQIVEQSVDGVLKAALDVGIMLTSFQTAAESLGYGTTVIGAARYVPKEMIRIFKLPASTYPIVGTTIGVPTQAAKDYPLKPRISLESFVMQDTYNAEVVEKGVDEYEQTLIDYRKANGMDYKMSYKGEVTMHYANYYKPQVTDTLISQGFDFSVEEAFKS